MKRETPIYAWDAFSLIGKGFSIAMEFSVTYILADPLEERALSRHLFVCQLRYVGHLARVQRSRVACIKMGGARTILIINIRCQLIDRLTNLRKCPLVSFLILINLNYL